jgi:hypothetical protein
MAIEYRYEPRTQRTGLDKAGYLDMNDIDDGVCCVHRLIYLGSS